MIFVIRLIIWVFIDRIRFLYKKTYLTTLKYMMEREGEAKRRVHAVSNLHHPSGINHIYIHTHSEGLSWLLCNNCFQCLVSKLMMMPSSRGILLLSYALNIYTYTKASTTHTTAYAQMNSSTKGATYNNNNKKPTKPNTTQEMRRTTRKQKSATIVKHDRAINEWIRIPYTRCDPLLNTRSFG